MSEQIRSSSGTTAAETWPSELKDVFRIACEHAYPDEVEVINRAELIVNDLLRSLRSSSYPAVTTDTETIAVLEECARRYDCDARCSDAADERLKAHRLRYLAGQLRSARAGTRDARSTDRDARLRRAFWDTLAREGFEGPLHDAILAGLRSARAPESSPAVDAGTTDAGQIADLCKRLAAAGFDLQGGDGADERISRLLFEARASLLAQKFVLAARSPAVDDETVKPEAAR